MKRIRKLVWTLANVLSVPGALGAALRAPRVSLTSLSIVGRLVQMGIRPRTIMDIGANRGQFSSACVAFFPESQVYAVEAIPSLRSDLEETFRGKDNVSVITAAVGSHAEVRQFFVNEYTHSSSFLPLHENHLQAFANARVTVPVNLEVTTLDDLCRVNSIESPELLKLDVQGFELEILRGATRTLASVRWVLLEAGFRCLYKGQPLFSEVHSFMQDRGLRLVAPVDVLPDPRSGLILQMDVVYERIG